MAGQRIGEVRGKVQTTLLQSSEQTPVQALQEGAEEILKVSRNMQCAGRIKCFLHEWRKITSNKLVLSWVTGYKIPFERKPFQVYPPKTPKLTENEVKLYSKSIQHLLEIGAVKTVKKCENQFLSGFFLRQKDSGEYRFILNLKRLNKCITPPHFKLEDIRTAKNLITKNCFLASIDLKDAYFLVPILEEHKKYLRFAFHKQIFEFQCLPFGLATAPFCFTKLLKPVFSFLRERRFLSVVYLDDCLLYGTSSAQCEQNVVETSKLLKKLGFLINTEKSHTEPTQNIDFLGFTLNTKCMEISITQKRIVKIKTSLQHFLNKNRAKIRDFSKIIGCLVAVCVATEYGWFHLKSLEREKYIALKTNRENYNAKTTISSDIKNELQWWLKQVNCAKQSILQPNYKVTIFSDASRSGWGAYSNRIATKGFWEKREQAEHINTLELRAAFYGLKSFAKDLKNCHILLKIDNKTAISVINKMGSVKYKKLNNQARQLWQWCEDRRIFVFATYINTLENVIADKNSRIKNVDTEYSLNNEIFLDVTKKLGVPEIDLFASYLNKKCKRFASRFPDPESEFVDAFTKNWKNLKAYIFPPFSLLPKILSKIENDQAECLVVFPIWKTQPWYPKLESMIRSEVVFLNPRPNLLLSPFREPHPLWKNLTLGAANLSSLPLA